MKRKKRIFSVIIAIFLLTPLFYLDSRAASGNANISSVSGTVGSTVTVSCTVTCQSGPIGTANVVLTYDPAGLEYIGGTGGYSLIGGSGSVSYKGLTQDGVAASLSFSMQFKIKKAGEHAITGTATGYDVEEETLEISVNTGTVTGRAETTSNSGGSNSGSNSGGNQGGNQQQEDTRDKNSKLSSLQVSPGTLSPAFSANTTSYTVTVPDTTTEITIGATAQSSKASVSVSGGKDLKLGANDAKVIVTAENGSTTVYALTIMCGELEKIPIENTEYVIDEEFSDESIPTGFVREKVSYNGREYEALSHEKSGLKLIGLKNGDTESVFYIYDVETQEFYNFIQITIAEGKYIIPLPLTENEQFKANEKIVLNLEDKDFEAWQIDEDYSVLLMMNAEGEEVLYQYDKVDGTFQRYAGPVKQEAEPVVEETEEKTYLEEFLENFLEKYALYVICGLAALSLVLAIALIYFIATRKHRHAARKRKMQKKLEKQKAKQEEAKLDEELDLTIKIKEK